MTRITNDEHEIFTLNFSRCINRDVACLMLSFKNEDASSKKVSIQDETGKSKDQPSETSGAATPQSSAPEEGTGEVKGIKNYILLSTDLKDVRLGSQ